MDEDRVVLPKKKQGQGQGLVEDGLGHMTQPPSNREWLESTIDDQTR